MQRWVGKWFGAVWPDAVQRRRVAAQYAALAENKLLLADIAARNYVFAPAPGAENLFEAGIAEGRRRAALEIIELAGADPSDVPVAHLIPPRGTTQGDDDARGSNSPSWERWHRERSARG
jgi:hypothetical protein